MAVAEAVAELRRGGGKEGDREQSGMGEKTRRPQLTGPVGGGGSLQ